MHAEDLIIRQSVCGTGAQDLVQGGWIQQTTHRIDSSSAGLDSLAEEGQTMEDETLEPLASPALSDIAQRVDYMESLAAERFETLESRLNAFRLSKLAEPQNASRRATPRRSSQQQQVPSGSESTCDVPCQDDSGRAVIAAVARVSRSPMRRQAPRVGTPPRHQSSRVRTPPRLQGGVIV